MTYSASSYTCFDGHRRIAHGSLAANALAAKQALAAGTAGPVLIFDDDTGRNVDLDLRGSSTDIETRFAAQPAPTSTETIAPDQAEPRGRGRPRLGVVAREVTLLPRHWEWLSTQSGGASVALRKLVEQARRDNDEKDRVQQAYERAYHFMVAVAGNLPDFEEATRALFAEDANAFGARVAAWPSDVRMHAIQLAFG